MSDRRRTDRRATLRCSRMNSPRSRQGSENSFMPAAARGAVIAAAGSVTAACIRVGTVLPWEGHAPASTAAPPAIGGYRSLSGAGGGRRR